MEVYIEYVILDNLIMDYLLLKESAKLLKIKFKRYRLIIGAIVGVIGAVVFPLLKIRAEFLFLLKIMLGAFITFISVDHTKFSDYLKYFNVFLLMTFVLGGGVIGVFYLLGIDLKSYQSYGLPIGVTALFGYLLVIGVKKCLKSAVNGLMTDRYRYKCILKCGNVTLKTVGYFDSGNLLMDQKTGLPVALCKKKVIDKMVKKGAEFPPVREMDYSTVSSYGKLKLYTPDCILIEDKNGNIRRNCLLGEAEDTAFSEDLLIGAYIL